MRRVSLDGDRQLAYAEYGRSDGTPVVFLHGTPGSRLLGRLLEPAAEDLGIRVLAPDRPGYGRSSPWAERSVRDAEAFLTPVLDDAGVESAGVVAFSGGAPYALAAAATRPDRIDRIDLVAGATPPALSEATPAIQRLLGRLATTTPAALRGLFRGQAWLASRLAPSFVLAQYTDDAESVPDAAAETVKADFVEAFADSRRGAVTEFRHATTDWGIDFADVTGDVRLWHGDADANVPIADARRLETQLPNAELRALNDADHLQTLLRSVPDVLATHR
ncbi:alpha/beta hydrolase [Natronomonas halophila]|uniref:alpha/beta fold hydrolase n=1 Tax=Natronomonas halophila TaxID=2747817 RepID=UPI0015B6B3EB|nr:alpha/beta hydrolase [Natronomonas halophila]QLD86096.1 alpha/beta hydrolase [Natronomonas halophila]